MSDTTTFAAILALAVPLNAILCWGLVCIARKLAH